MLTSLRIVCSLLLILTGSVNSLAAAADRPNILFLFADDQRADTISAHGNPNIQTPNLDRIAASGVSFRRNYCFGGNSGAVCVPSRAMLMSGRYWQRVDTNTLKGTLLWPEYFASHGYKTFGTGKWHNGQQSWLRCFQSGTSVMFGGMSDHTRVPLRDLGADGKLTAEYEGGDFSSEIFANSLIEFLERQDGTEPFLAYAAFTAPHDPRQAPDAFLSHYRKALPPLPANFLPQHPFDNGMMKDLRDENLAAWPRTEEAIREQLAEYYALISHLDQQIGRVLEVLERRGLRENTIIVYAGDNGLALGSHGLLGKQSVYEHSMRTPLIIAGPGIPTGKSTESFTYLLDLFPTLCEATRITLPPDLDGKSLMPILGDPSATIRDSVFLPYMGIQRAVRDDRWKLIAYPKIGHLQLFDLENDPDEKQNLIDSPQTSDQVPRLLQLMKQWQTELNDTLEVPTTNKHPEPIDMTGYPRKPDQWQPDWIVEKYFKSKLTQAPAKKPNVLFIAVDDLRCELGCFGVEQIQTPNIDQLAKTGTLFTRSYVQQAVCNPSRVSMLTGLRPDTTKVWDLVTDFRSTIPEAKTIPQHFREHGYKAIAYGKLFHNTFPDDVSWDEPTHKPSNLPVYSPASRKKLAEFRQDMRDQGKPDAAVERMRGPATESIDVDDEATFDGKQTSEAIEQLKNLTAQEKPFFLAVGYIRPHLPFVSPKKYWDQYKREEIPLAVNPFLPKNMPEIAFGQRSRGGFYELTGYMDYVDAPSPFSESLTEAQQRELKHGYYASVSFIDQQIGRLLKALNDIDKENETIVVLWSDHGWKLGEHNSWCKQTNYEIDTRAPLIIRAPNVASAGKPVSAIVESIDLYPTLCDLAGLPTPSELEGETLRPLLDNPTAAWTKPAISQFPRPHAGREYMGYALRSDKYRYIEWIDRVDGSVLTSELYDHQNDPMENENIASDPKHADVIRQHSELLWKTIPKPKPSIPVKAISFQGSDRTNRVHRKIEGWNLHIEKQLIDAMPELTEKAVTMLSEQLKDIVKKLPPHVVEKLKKVDLYFSAEYPGEGPRAEFHPGSQWLKDNGRDPAMVESVEFTNIRNFREETVRMPNFVLHELAHAYHFRFIPQGHANEEITKQYDRAKSSGKYDRVARRNGENQPTSTDRAYGMNNPMEFFAESTEAYFGTNDFFPFNQKELREFDPETSALIARMWEVEKSK